MNFGKLRGMKILDGLELAGFIKERQAQQVRALRQAWHVAPHLAIIQTIDNPVIDTYVHLKQKYGEDILVDVTIHKIDQTELMSCIEDLNKDESVHGIIIQLPLADESDTEKAVNAVSPEKDVDGLGEHAVLTPATAMAIDWLVAGYNVEMNGRVIAIVGNGRLVGAPLSKLWQGAGYNVTVYDSETADLSAALKEADIIVTATGVPSLVSSSMVKLGATVVDAGTAAEHGKIVGDLATDVRERDDLTITPEKGGVGPLTVTALFDNVIRAAQATVKD
jgi:methylenetetrahydrofolate dehydrogenase (NADP+)/methenyltetrahydrofolate cyclohydrolase